MYKKTILLISPFSFGNEHITFEIAFLQIILNMNSCNVIFFGEKSHCKIIEEILDSHSNIFYITTKKSYGKLLFGYLIILKAFFYYTKYRKSKTIFLSFENPHIIFLTALFRDSIGILHRNKGTNTLRSFIKYIGIRFFAFNNHVLLLGDWLKKNISIKNISWIYHPIITGGVISKFKKSTNSFHICIFCQPEYEHLLPKVKNILSAIPGSSLSELKAGLKITTSEYLTILGKSSYCIFLEDMLKYNEYCSGRFFDAVSFSIPIISQHCSMGDSLSKNLNHTGYYFDDLNSLIKELPKIFCNKFHRNSTNTSIERIQLYNMDIIRSLIL